MEDISESKFLSAVNGIHLDGKSNYDVKFLDIHNITDLQFIPQGIDLYFPNLEAINFVACNLTSLRGDELMPFLSIKWLRLVGNRFLERIPGFLFEGKPQMEVVCFSTNNIKQVGFGLLDGLANLKHVDFHFNNCVNKLVENDETLSETELSELKSELLTKCSDDLQVGPPPFICGDDFDQNICELQEQNIIMKEQNAVTKDLIKRMTIKMDDLTEKNEKMEGELSEILLSFDEIMSCAAVV